MYRSLYWLCIFLVAVSVAWGQPGGKMIVLTADMKVNPPAAAAGQAVRFEVTLSIADGLHINSHTPVQDFLIPLELTFPQEGAVQIEGIDYPAPLLKAFEFSEERMSVYEGKVQITVRAKVTDAAANGRRSVTAVLSYQGCNDKSCFAPASDTLRTAITITITSKAGIPVVTASNSDGADANTAQTVSAEETRAAEILQKGLGYSLVAFFLIGLALNLTPCVYPIIPITVSYFGGQQARSRSSSLVSALFYLLGIALSFALLGLLSSIAGKQWGFLFQSPWFVVSIAAIMILMAASMFGAFEINVPTFLLTKFGSSREGVIGSLVMGLTVGVIIAPCAAGIIIGLVSLVARMGLVIRGGLLFFAMGLGLGLPYLVLATFSGLLNRLPQSGEWMIWVKKVFGFLLLGVAFYFLAPQLERLSNKFAFLAGLTGVVGGLLLGFLDHSGGSRSFGIFKKIVGVLLLVLGINWINSAIQEKTVTLPWNHYNGQSIEQILASGKPVFMDFYADWCAPCKQLDRETFNDKRVSDQADQFYFLKVDCTKPDAATRAFMELYQVNGMPTLVFLTPGGKEIASLREIGFINADKFLSSMEQAQVTKE
jgi:thioredoxin:protein disulfide reductase